MRRRKAINKAMSLLEEAGFSIAEKVVYYKRFSSQNDYENAVYLEVLLFDYKTRYGGEYSD